MRFSTIVSALALATSVTAAAITPDLQSTSDSLSQKSIEVNDLAGLLSAEHPSPAELPDFIAKQLREVVQQLREIATQSLTEVQTRVKQIITQIAETLADFLEGLSNPDVSGGDRSLSNSNDFDQACQSFKNAVPVMADTINHVLDQAPENLPVGDLGPAIAPLEKSLDMLVSLMFPALPGSSCQTPPDIQHLRDTLQRAKKMTQ